MTTPDDPAPGRLSDHERPFGREELFFSATDRKGIIRACNDVFVRVSAYARDELSGKPHNVIRHPDMPRCVFRLFWNYLERNAPVAAYVKNRAKDGGYYWVLAVAVPVQGGYLSVRIKPETELFATTRAIYAELRAMEVAAEGPTGRERKAAMEASSVRLTALLAEHGFADYDAFMRRALTDELRARHAALDNTHPFEEALRDAREQGYDGELRRLTDACAAIHEFLCSLFADLAEYERMNVQLAGKARFVLDLASDVRLYAMNALIASTRLGDSGAALGAVANLLSGASRTTGDVTRVTGEGIARAIAVLHELEFEISVATVQSEMAMFFSSELRAAAAVRGEAPSLSPDTSMFLDCLASSIESVIDRLNVLETELADLAPHLVVLAKGLGSLRTLEVNGRIEAARIGQAGGLDALFAEIGDGVERARGEVADLAALAATSHAGGLQDARRRLGPHLARLHAAGAPSAPLAA